MCTVLPNNKKYYFKPAKVTVTDLTQNKNKNNNLITLLKLLYLNYFEQDTHSKLNEPQIKHPIR